MDQWFHQILECPWYPRMVDTIDWTDVSELKKLDSHLSPKSDCSYTHPVLRDFFRDTSSEGYKPLLSACSGGALPVVRYVVEKWAANVNRPVYGGFYATEKTFPLYVAAVSGHSEILLYLIERGANIPARNYVPEHNGVTALHAAIFYSHTRRKSIDQPISHEVEVMIRHLVEKGANPSAGTSSRVPMWRVVDDDVHCLKLLIELGMDLYQRDPKHGRTILHHWVSKKHDPLTLAIIKLLLQKKVYLNRVDYDGLTPLYLAALCEDYDSCPAVIKFFLDHKDISIEEKISALELAGSGLIYNDWLGRQRGMDCWKEATRLREAHNMPKKPLTLTPEVKEFTTIAELEKMQSNDSECTVQSILVRQRILSRISVRAVMVHQWPIVREYLSERDFDGPFLEVCKMMVESVRTSWAYNSRYIIMDIIYYLSSQLKELKIRGMIGTTLSKEKLLTAFELVSEGYRYYMANTSDRVRHNDEPNLVECICDLIFAVDGIIPDNDQRMMKCVYELVKQDGRDWKGQSLLHVACDMHLSESHGVVRLLLLAGEDVSAIDNNRDSPLHTLTQRSPGALDSPTATLLIDAGVHIDWTNKQGKTAREISDMLHCGFGPKWMRKRVLPLTCLSARVIARHRKSYDLNNIPLALYSYINRH